MSSISQYIGLTDGVSGPLKKMSDNANAAANRMENLGKVATVAEGSMTQMASPAAALTRISTAATGAAESIDRIIPAAAGARGAISGIGTMATGVISSIKSSLTGIVSMFVGMFAMGNLISTMQKSIAVAGEMAQAELRLQVIMRQRMGATNDVIDSIRNLITEQQSLGVVSRSVQTAGAQQLATFLTQRDALATLIPAMNNLAVQQHGSKATAEDMVNISNMMGRALQGNTGALTRCGITFSDAQANVLKYGNEMERAATMAEVITQNVGNMNAEFGKTAAGQAAQKMNQVNDVLIRIGKSISGAFNALKISSADIQIGGLEMMGAMLVNIINIAAWFAQEVTAAYNEVKPFFQEVPQFVSDNWAFIEPIVAGAAAALIVYAAAVTIAAVATEGLAIIGSITVFIGDLIAGLSLVVESIMSVGFAETFAELAASGMWSAILLPVAIVIAAIYFVVAVINYFAKTSISATGIVVGAFFWLGGVIYNIVAMAWNLFLGFATFLGSVFRNPLAAIYNLFATIWNGVVTLVAGAINQIISMINHIPGVNLSAVSASGIMSSNIPIDGAPDLSGYQMDYKDPADVAAYGYDVGAGLGDSIKGVFTPTVPEMPANDIPAGPGIPEAIENGSGPAKDTAGHTGKMADKMDDVDEDLKYLREVAEQEAINKYTTAEVRIEMGGVHNNVGSDVDVDGMMRYMNNSLVGAMQAGAEAVHP